METDWGGKCNCTSCGCPMANWQGYEHIQLDTTPQKLIGIDMTLTLTIWISPYSLKLIGEHKTQVSALFWLTWIVMQGQRNSSSKDYGEKKLQRAYAYILQITEFYWTQSKYFPHEKLIKHWDPFKILQMCGIIFISRSTFMKIPMSSKNNM